MMSTDILIEFESLIQEPISISHFVHEGSVLGLGPGLGPGPGQGGGWGWGRGWDRGPGSGTLVLAGCGSFSKLQSVHKCVFLPLQF